MKTKEQKRAEGQRHYAKHRETILAKQQARRREQSGHVRKLDHAQHLRKHYGIDKTQYAAMLTAQGGCCAICRRPPFKQRLSVDHCHATGRVRGLLCPDCNTAIGLFRDEPCVVRAAAAYLEVA